MYFNGRLFVSSKYICIIGAGKYGSALAQVFAEKHNVTIVTRNQDTKNSINLERKFSCLCRTKVHKNISCSDNYSDVVKASMVLICTPVSAVRSVCYKLKESGICKDIPVILCSKGIEVGTSLFTTEIARSVIENDIFVFSGPSFATEIVCGLPACVSLAGSNIEKTTELCQELSTNKFILEPNNDVIGTQICGAFKNVLAVLCGMLDGLNLGKSAVTFVISKAVEEIAELSVFFGGSSKTVQSVCGIGDIILTCTNEESRNMRFGKFLALGGHLEQWTGELAEGVFTTQAIPEFISKKAPVKIFKLVYDIVYGKKDIKTLKDITCFV